MFYVRLLYKRAQLLRSPHIPLQHELENCIEVQETEDVRPKMA